MLAYPSGTAGLGPWAWGARFRRRTAAVVRPAALTAEPGVIVLSSTIGVLSAHENQALTLPQNDHRSA